MSKKTTKKLFKVIEENETIVLTEEFRETLEETLETLVKEEVDKKDIDLKESEGKLATANEQLEEANATIVSKDEEIKKIKEVTLETVKEEVESYKEDLVGKLDSFLESELSELVPDSVLEAVAKVEVYEPIVEGIKATFGDKGIEIDSEGHNVLKEAKTEIESLREDVNKVTADKIALEQKSEELLAKYVLKEKCEGLTLEQSEKVQNVFKGDSVETIEEKFDSVMKLVVEAKDDDEEEKDETVQLKIDEAAEPEKDVIIKEDKEEDLGQSWL